MHRIVSTTLSMDDRCGRARNLLVEARALAQRIAGEGRWARSEAERQGCDLADLVGKAQNVLAPLVQAKGGLREGSARDDIAEAVMAAEDARLRLKRALRVSRDSATGAVGAIRATALGVERAVSTALGSLDAAMGARYGRDEGEQRLTAAAGRRACTDAPSQGVVRMLVEHGVLRRASDLSHRNGPVSDAPRMGF